MVFHINRLRFLLLLVFLAAFTLGHSQQVIPKKRPKVALVLSGGGAKGMAHIGLLKVLEEAGIKPDIVVGTSMGSIVGGYYALGFSPDSIQSIIQQTDWDIVLSNKVLLRQVNTEEKKNLNEYIMEFPIEKWKPELPSGAIKGHEIELMFDRLAWSSAKYKSFDEFPIQFRCVSVDILTGKPYVFKDGALSLALRASMSIPTVMSPVKYKGMLLVDGGLVKNFPVDIAKELGADIIIGDYTGGKLLPEKELNSLLNILKQSSLLAGIMNAKVQRKDVDIYVEPDLSGLSVSDFSKADSIIARGYKAAYKHLSELKVLSGKLKKFQKQTNNNSLTDSLFITKFEIEGIKDKYTKKAVLGFLRNENAGWYNYLDIEKNCQALYGTRLFDKVGYRIVPMRSSAYKIVYQFQERNKNNLSFAVNYSGYSKAAIILDLVLRNLYVSGSKLEAKVAISTLPKAKIRFTKYLGKRSMMAYATGYHYEESLFPFYNEETWVKSAEYLRKHHFIDLQWMFLPSRQLEISTGLNIHWIIERPLIESDVQLIKKINFSTKAASFQILYNHLDKKHFPERGIYNRFTTLYYINPEYHIKFDLNGSEYESYFTSNFLQFRNKFAAYSKFGKVNMSNEVDVYVSFSENANRLNSFILGGCDNSGSYFSIPFWGLPKNFTILGSGLLYRIGFRYEFIKNFYLTTKANTIFDIYVADDQPEDDATYLDSKLLTGAGIALSYNSIIGPISFVVSKSLNYGPYWTYVNIGFRF